MLTVSEEAADFSFGEASRRQARSTEVSFSIAGESGSAISVNRATVALSNLTASARKMIEVDRHRPELQVERTLARAWLRRHVELTLLLADQLGEHDAGIWLDRARVSLDDSRSEVEYPENVEP